MNKFIKEQVYNILRNFNESKYNEFQTFCRTYDNGINILIIKDHDSYTIRVKTKYNFYYFYDQKFKFSSKTPVEQNAKIQKWVNENFNFNSTLDISYEDLENAFKILKQNLGNFIPDTIVAIPRGGLFLAQLLAYHFDLHKSNITLVDDLYSINSEIFKDKKVLICDDIVDSGETIGFFSHLLRTGNCVFATFYKRYTAKKFNNHIYGKKIESDDYLLFPWDRD